MRAKKGEGLQWIYAHLLDVTDDCIEWPFGRSNGYGWLRSKGRTWPAHRFMCLLAHGKPDRGQTDVAHSCGNKLCCNPAHLRHATPEQNQKDKFSHGTVLRGESIASSKLKRSDVVEIKKRLLTETATKLADEYKVTVAAVSLISKGKTWAHV